MPTTAPSTRIGTVVICSGMRRLSGWMIAVSKRCGPACIVRCQWASVRSARSAAISGSQDIRSSVSTECPVSSSQAAFTLVKFPARSQANTASGCW